jgi:hypothetical protein
LGSGVVVTLPRRKAGLKAKMPPGIPTPYKVCRLLSEQIGLNPRDAPKGAYLNT